MNAAADTGLNLTITAVGTLPGSKDTASFILTIDSWQAGVYASQLKGVYNDTSYNTVAAQGNFIDVTAGTTYQDDFTQSIFTSTVTSDNGSTMTGTFKGVLYLQGGNGADSVIINNGSFNVQL